MKYVPAIKPISQQERAVRTLQRHARMGYRRFLHALHHTDRELHTTLLLYHTEPWWSIFKAWDKELLALETKRLEVRDHFRASYPHSVPQ